MATQLYLSPFGVILQALSNIGQPLAGGRLSIYQAGTNLYQTTYTDSTGTTANPNPITLSSSGRQASAQGAPTSIWVPANTPHKLVLADALGNVLNGGPSLDWVYGINDPTFGLLPFQAFTSGSGVDLVGNAVKSFATFASMRAASTPGASGGGGSGQTLVCLVEGGTSIGDGLGGAFYWSPTSVAADDNLNAIWPTAQGSVGRWLRLGQPLAVTTSGTFVGTLTGMAGAVAGIVNWSKTNNVVTLTLPAAIQGTSNATTMTLTGMSPSALLPAIQRSVTCLLTDSGTNQGGWALVAASGTITFGLTFANTTSGFTNTGTKGLPGSFLLQYQV